MDLDNIIVPNDISVQSNEERIVIDPITRVINIPEDYIIGVESDEKSDRMYFQCPKIVGDNVDLSKLKLYVNFENANKERDNYFVDDVTVNEGNILFSWLFSRKVTKYKGDVKFIVCAKKSEDNLALEWNTTVAKGLSLEGIEVELSDEEQSIASDYLIQLEKELSALAESENNRLLTTSSNQITNITNKGSEQVQLVENTAKKALDSIPSTYTDLQKQVNEVEDRELKDANGITQELTITDGYAQLTDTATKRLNSLVIKGNTVQVTTKGYQLFYLPDDTKISNGVTTTIKDGLISCEGTVTVNGWFDVCGKLNISLKQGIEYTFSINKALSVRCALKTSENELGIDRIVQVGKTSVQFTPKSDISSAYIWIDAPIGTNIDIQFMIQVEKGSTAHDYEPYTGGKPSPNPEHPQEIKAVNKLSGVMCGKNLFNYNTYIKNNKQLKIIIKGGKTLFRNDSISSGLNYKIYDINNNILGTFISLNFTATNPLKLPTNASYIEIKSDNPFRNLYIGYSSNTTYEPYIGSILNYTLQNPLYKIGDVYDYIDFNRGKIIRNVGVVTFDGSDDELWNKYSNNVSMDGYSVNISNAIDTTPCICNKLLTTDTISATLEEAIKVLNNAMYVVLNKIRGLNTTELFKSWLQSNPITVYYQLAIPTEEDIPTELLTQLKQLQTYSGETNISFEASDVYPTIDLEYIKDTKKYIESKTDLNAFVENMFALQRTGDIYTVKFPKWETSHVSTGEKLDANAGLVCEPSTKTIKGQNDYENIPLFKTYDVNAYVDDEGVRHVTAIKGDKDFKDEGKVDVFVLGMSYYEKVWEDDQYWYYSRTDSPRDGYTIARECINRDGTIQPFALYSKYVAGNIDGNLYSSKGLKPARYYEATPLPANTTNTNTSYSGLINQCHKRGSFYSGGMTCDYKYILTTFYLKYGTLNTQSIMRGCDNYSAQYEASIKSSTNNTYFPLTKAQANYFPVGASVSIGYKYGGSNLDRYYSTVSIYADNVKIIKKVALDDSNTALYLDTNAPFNTADTSLGAVFCSTMHWRSGFSDDILGRDGCPCETKSELTNGKFPIVIQGIECMVGGYETYGNAFMDIVDASGKREVYIQNDASLLTTNMTTAKSTYKKSPYSIQPTKLNSWNYITRIDFDLENGAFVQSNCGQDGSGTAVGFADGLYVDNASSGQREFLGFGYLSGGFFAGLSCLLTNAVVGPMYWYVLTRLSINGVRG